MKPGIYQMTADTYHADPCPVPSLSSSIARLLLDQSPRHAWSAHPKLNPNFEPEDDRDFDLGTAAHAYLLEGQDNFALIDAPDWRTKTAREQREVAKQNGKHPLLMHRWESLKAMVEAAKQQLEGQEPPRPLAAGKPEQTLIWQEEGLWLRARLDWLHDDHRFIDDLKSTGGSAQPEAWIRGHLFATGYDVQAAFYLRGLRMLTGKEATFRFVVIETEPPYALSVIGLGPEALELANRKVERAIAEWRHCLETNHWPGYPTRTAWADVPAWERTRWEEREVMATVHDSLDDGRPLADQLFGDETRR